MSDDLISIIDLARQTGKRKQGIFKVLRRLGIVPTKGRSSSNRGQMISYVTSEESQQVVAEISRAAVDSSSPEIEGASSYNAELTEQGVFYLLALEPDHDPGRFKVGFAANLSERMRALRCSAPFAKIVRTWPCKRLWEKTAIECVTQGCRRLHTEVFRAGSLESVVDRCQRFSDLMPTLPPKN